MISVKCFSIAFLMNHSLRRAWTRFWEFGGFRLLGEYARMGLVWTAVKAAVRCLLGKRPITDAYFGVLQKVEKTLTERYEPLLLDALHECRSAENNGEQTVPHIVWTCWLQGMEDAPALVRACIASQKEMLADYDHRVLTLDNYRQWVDVPEIVERKYAKGLIPAALFSDILRVAALKKYGGVWMDASVLCTGFDNDVLKAQWLAVENSRFTVCRYYARGARVPSGLSNWFIAAASGNVVLTAVYDMLVAYWKDYNCTVDYYMMHLFISLALRALPELDRAMPKINSRFCFLLGNSLGKDFNEVAWRDLIAHVGMHKLNYRKADEALLNLHSYCCYIIGA